MSEWRTAPIGEVLEDLGDGRRIHQGWSPQCELGPSESVSEWAVLKTTAVQDGQFVDIHNKRLPDALEARPRLEVKANDLLLTCAGPRARCGVVTLVRSTRPRLMISGKLYRFRANPAVMLPGFLEGVLRSPESQLLIDEMKTGMSESGMNLTHERFGRLQVPVPPLPVQRRIVKKLDELLAQSRAAREQLEAVPALVETYRQSILAAAFRGDLTNTGAGAWPVRRLEEIVDEGPSNGFSPRSTGRSAGPLGLKLTATTSGVFRLDDAAVKRLDEPVPADSRAWLEPGDLLVQRANTLEYLGAAAIFEGPLRTYIYPDLMMRLRIKNPVTRKFLWRFINSPSARAYFRSRATGTAGNMPKITGAVLRELEVPFPELKRQGEVVGLLDSAWAASSSALTASEEAHDDILSLERSLLAKAFRGELDLDGTDAEVVRLKDAAKEVGERALSGKRSTAERTPAAHAAVASQAS